MYGMKRYLMSALLAIAALCASTTLLGQAVFNGTWRVDMSKVKFSEKPWTSYISQGWYHCEFCNPTYSIPADGQDHAVAGQAYDTDNITIVDPRTTHDVTKKGGKILQEGTSTVSADGKTLTLKMVVHPANGSDVATYDYTFKRQGTLPAGVHATSGNWVVVKGGGSENGQTWTYKVNGDEIAMTDPTGESYTAKLDGTDAPVKGGTGWDTVSLKRIDDHTIQETDKFNGKVVWVGKSTVSANGKTMTVVGTEKPSERTTTYVATKR